VIENGDYGVRAVNVEVGLYDCEILDNYLTSDGTLPAAGVHVAVPVLEMRGCRLARNRVTGLNVDACQSLIIDNCEIVDQPWGRGGEIDNCPDVQITNTLFLRCAVPTSSGGGLLIADSSGRIEFCVFAYDSARSGWGGADSWGLEHPDLKQYVLSLPLPVDWIRNHNQWNGCGVCRKHSGVLHGG
jgi:hypothetical protein